MYSHSLRWFSNYCFPSPHAVADFDRGTIAGRQKMIDAAAKHDEPDALPAFKPLIRPEVANYSPRQITGDLNKRMVATMIVSNPNRIALVVLAGSIAEGRAELTFGVLKRYYVARNWRTIHVDVEW
jgi:hypothetical protein